MLFSAYTDCPFGLFCRGRTRIDIDTLFSGWCRLMARYLLIYIATSLLLHSLSCNFGSVHLPYITLAPASHVIPAFSSFPFSTSPFSLSLYLSLFYSITISLVSPLPLISLFSSDPPTSRSSPLHYLPH